MQRLGRISRRGGITRYHQLYTYLRRALLEGSIAPGSALPSEVQLMRQYGISRNTVRRALEDLQRERLVVRLQGSGTYARSTAEAGRARSLLSALAQDGRGLETVTQKEILQFSRLGTPDSVLRRWPAFGRECTLVCRSRSHEGRVFAVCSSYVSEAFAGALDRGRLGDAGVLEELARLDALCRSGTLSVTALEADAVTARHLGIPGGSPVLCAEAMSLAADQRPVEYRKHLYRPDRFRLQWPVAFGEAAGWTLTRASSMGL